MIVGHTPIDRENTLWLDVDGIANHHVLFSANPEQVGVFTRVGGTMIPLVYPVDALTPIINALDHARLSREDSPRQQQHPELNMIMIGVPGKVMTVRR